MNNEIDSQDNILTKLVSVLLTVIFLIFSFFKGMPFTWKLSAKLLEVFNSEIAQPKVDTLIVLWRATLILGLLLLIQSLFWAHKEAGKFETSIIPRIYELTANVVIIIGSIALILLFHFKCSLETTTQSLAGFVVFNVWLLLVLIVKGILFFLSAKTLKLPRLVPAMVLVAAFVCVCAFFTLRPMKKVGYENYSDDLSHIEERVEDKAVNSLNSTVSVDDTIYAILVNPSSENNTVRDLMRISKNGETERLDGGCAGNVTNYQNTIFYVRYAVQTTLCSLNVKDQSRDEFSADDVSEDLKYLFLNQQFRLLSVRGEHLYFSVEVYKENIDGLNEISDEIWRIKVSNGKMDKSSLEKYAWNCKSFSSHIKVCYQNLQYYYPGYHTEHLIFYNAERKISIGREPYSSSELGIEEKWSRNYDLFHISSGSGLKKEAYNHVEKALAYNVYKGVFYYALLEGSELQIYKDDLDLASPVLIDKYEVDVTGALRYEEDCKLLISDSYLLFLHRNSSEYRDVFEVSTL